MARAECTLSLVGLCIYILLACVFGGVIRWMCDLPTDHFVLSPPEWTRYETRLVDTYMVESCTVSVNTENTHITESGFFLLPASDPDHQPLRADTNVSYDYERHETFDALSTVYVRSFLVSPGTQLNVTQLRWLNGHWHTGILRVWFTNFSSSSETLLWSLVGPLWSDTYKVLPNISDWGYVRFDYRPVDRAVDLDAVLHISMPPLLPDHSLLHSTLNFDTIVSGSGRLREPISLFVGAVSFRNHTSDEQITGHTALVTVAYQLRLTFVLPVFLAAFAVCTALYLVLFILYKGRQARGMYRNVEISS